MEEEKEDLDPSTLAAINQINQEFVENSDEANEREI